MTGNRNEIIQWLLEQDSETIFDIKEHRKKRSLNANAYCWTLLSKIATELGITKEDVYREYIKDKGVCRVITMNSEAVNTFITAWGKQGLGWLCETSKTNIAGLTDVIAYYGTSSYNTKQMASFIDYVVAEAKVLNIETLPPTQIFWLKENWGKEKEV
jgi:hypothetical protein